MSSYKMHGEPVWVNLNYLPFHREIRNDGCGKFDQHHQEEIQKSVTPQLCRRQTEAEIHQSVNNPAEHKIQEIVVKQPWNK